MKVYLLGAEGNIFVCPSCGIKKKLDKNKLAQLMPNVKVRCSCGKQYVLELRGSYRKPVEIPCILKGLVKPISSSGIIKDLSIKGMRIQLPQAIELIAGDSVLIEFELETESRPHITAKCQVKRVAGQQIGVEVLSWDNNEREVWYFLLPT